MLSFFRRAVLPSVSKTPVEFFQGFLERRGLNKLFTPEQLRQSQDSTCVYFNNRYFPPFSLLRTLKNTAAISVNGDRDGYFQNGEPFPSEPDFFAQLKTGESLGLSPEERLAASQKIIASQSWAVAYGGYPRNNPQIRYKNPFRVGIFSMAGAQFEMPYLHYKLFALDPLQQEVDNIPSYAHLYRDLPTHYDAAKQTLGDREVNKHLNYLSIDSSLFLGPTLITRTQKGFSTAHTENNAVIFLGQAYERYIFENVALLLTAVNENAKQVGKPALLKAAAVGMGFFSRIDCRYDISHYLYPYFLRAFKYLLETGEYPNIAVVEFPIFSEILAMIYDMSMLKFEYGGVKVIRQSRDLLHFSEEEISEFYPVVLNPTDSNAFPGNEEGFDSVEAMIGNNTSLRHDQVYLMNPNLLRTENHVGVQVDIKDYTTTILPQVEVQTVIRPS